MEKNGKKVISQNWPQEIESDFRKVSWFNKHRKSVNPRTPACVSRTDSVVKNIAVVIPKEIANQLSLFQENIGVRRMDASIVSPMIPFERVICKN